MTAIIIGLYNITFTLFGVEISITNMDTSILNMLKFGDVTKNQNGVTGFGDIWKMAKSVNGLLIPIGGSLLAMFCMMELISKSLEVDRVSWERYAMILVKYFLVYALMSNSYDLSKTVLKICNDVFKVVENGIKTNATTSISEILSSIIKGESWYNLWDKLVNIICFFILWIPYIGTVVAAISVVLMRVFKMTIMVAFAPIPMALCVNDSFSQGGKRYFMTMASLGVEAIIIFLSVLIYRIGMASIGGVDEVINASLGTLVSVILLNAVFVALVQGGTQIAREIMGV